MLIILFIIRLLQPNWKCPLFYLSVRTNHDWCWAAILCTHKRVSHGVKPPFSSTNYYPLDEAQPSLGVRHRLLLHIRHWQRQGTVCSLRDGVHHGVLGQLVLHVQCGVFRSRGPGSLLSLCRGSSLRHGGKLLHSMRGLRSVCDGQLQHIVVCSSGGRRQ